MLRLLYARLRFIYDASVQAIMGFGRYLGIRLVNLSIIIVGLVILDFFMFRTIGDPTALLAGNPSLKPIERAAIKASLGLDRPLYDQFTLYLTQLSHGDLGTSWFYHNSVAYQIGIRLPNTMLLLGTAYFISTLLGIVTGVKASSIRGRKGDVGIVTSSLFLSSLPVFWIGFLLISYLSVLPSQLHLPFAFPSGSTYNTGWSGSQLSTGFPQYVVQVLQHLALPVFALTLILYGGHTLLMRNTLIDVLSEDYIITARAKGLNDDDVLYKHAMRNAYLPIVSALAIQFGGILGGAILTETVFAYNGLGTLIIQSVSNFDWPILQGIFLIIGVMTVLANLVADILYGVLDPRVKVG